MKTILSCYDRDILRIASIARRITKLNLLYFHAAGSLFLVVNKHAGLGKMSDLQTKKPLKSLNGFEKFMRLFWGYRLGRDNELCVTLSE